MKTSYLFVTSILAGCLTFQASAEDRVYGQPVTPATPAVSAPAAALPPVSVTAQHSAPAAALPPAAAPAASAVPASAVPAQPVNKTRLTFMDSKLFDVKLGKELEIGKDVVEVDVSGRVPLSNIPARIDRWVVKSAEEGKVELLQSEPAPKTRFLFSLIPMVFNAVGYMKNMQEERMFDQAKNYDTVIYYKKDDTGETLIEKIVMTKRKR